MTCIGNWLLLFLDLVDSRPVGLLFLSVNMVELRICMLSLQKSDLYKKKKKRKEKRWKTTTKKKKKVCLCFSMEVCEKKKCFVCWKVTQRKAGMLWCKWWLLFLFFFFPFCSTFAFEMKLQIIVMECIYQSWGDGTNNHIVHFGAVDRINTVALL